MCITTIATWIDVNPGLIGIALILLAYSILLWEVFHSRPKKEGTNL